MKNKRIFLSRVIALFIIMVVSGSQLEAQEKGWELGGNVGVANYFGDLNTEFDVTHPGLSGGIKTRYNFNPRLAVAGGLRYAFLQGRDEWSDNAFQVARNLGFRSHTFELYSQLEFNFLKYIHGSRDYFFTPYLFGGPELLRFNPQNKRINNQGEEEWHALFPLGTEGQTFNRVNRKLNFSLIYGFGLKYDLNRNWSLNVAIAGRKIFSDYLDDVSTVYADKDQIRNFSGELGVYFSDPSIPSDEFPAIGQEGRQRGVEETTDMFTTVNLGIMYYFSYLSCPEISRIKP